MGTWRAFKQAYVKVRSREITPSPGERLEHTCVRQQILAQSHLQFYNYGITAQILAGRRR